MPSVFSLCVITVCCATGHESGLVALYTFDEGSGTVLHDGSGAGRNGRIIGGGWAKTAKGAALDFDGIGDYVDCEDDPSTRLKGPLTVAVWVRPFWQRKQSLVSRGDWNLTIGADGVPTMNARRAGTSKGGAMDTVCAGAPISAKEWSHVVGVYDTDRKRLEIYVNGALSGSTAKTDGSIGGIFRSKLVLGRRFNGLMADCRLYARALPAEEILSLREATAPDPSLRIPSCRLRLTARLFYRTRKIMANLVIRHPKPRGPIAAGVALLRPGESQPIQEKYIESLSAVAQAEVGFSLKDLSSGDYEVVASAKSADGKTLATLSKPVVVPEKPWWLDTGAGVTDQVLPPWTPIEVARSKDTEQTRIGCWGRVYEYGAAVFPQQIETSGKTMVAQPVRLVGQANGRKLHWVEESAPRVHEQTPARVKLSHKSTDGALELAAQTTIEYDGMVLIDFRVTPRQHTRVERLAFEIPLRQEHARLVYQYRDRLFRAPGCLPKEGLVRSFNPAIWLGDEERGLQWFAESDRDWYLADAERAIEIRQEEGNTVLRLNLVTKPIELKPDAKKTAGALPSLAYTFGLQATPVKPVTRDAWDYRTIGTPVYNNQYALLTEQIDGRPGLDYYAEQGVKTVFLTISWTDTFGYPACVGHSEELHRMVKACHVRGMQIIVYLGSLFADTAPEFPAFVEDFGRWSSSRPYSCYPFPNNTPPGRTQMCYGTCCGSEWRDFIVAGAARLVSEFGVDGFYLDGLGLAGPCYNPHHGCGYVRPDGTIGATYPFLAGRDLIKRLYHIVKSSNPNGQIDLHPAAFWFSPTVAWATNTWDGETILGDLRSRANRQGVHLLDYLPLDQFRAQFMGKPWGVPSEFLSYYVPYPYQRLHAMTLLHDVLIRPNSALGDLPFISTLWRLGDEFDRKGSEWIPYWRSSPYVTVRPQGAYVSLYRHPKNGILAVVSNLSKKRAQVRVHIDLGKLGLSGKNVATDPLSPSESVPIREGEIVLDLESVGWRLLRLRPE